MLDLAGELSALLVRKTCFVGVGNPIRSDDGAGPYLVQQAEKSIPSGRHSFLNAEDILESHVFELAASDCSNVVLVDALAAEAEPGAVVFGPLADFAEVRADCSTHKMSLSISGGLLEANGKNVFLLGIVPASIEYGTGLSESVTATADGVVRLLAELISKKEVPDAF